MNTNVCVASATSLTCSFDNNLKGNTVSALTCVGQYPLAYTSSSTIKLNFSSNWDLVTVTPSLTSSTPTMTYGGVSNGSGSFSKYITLTLGANTSASEAITFKLALKNPTSTNLASADLQIEYYDTTSVLKALSNPYAGGHTMSCQTGCATCTSIYNNCASCSSNYEQSGSTCLSLPDSQTYTWLNEYKGHETSSLTVSLQWPVAIPSGSTIKISYSDNWDFSSVIPSLTSSSPSLTLQALANISTSTFTKQNSIAIGTEIAQNSNIQLVITYKNPTATNVDNNDFVIEVVNGSSETIAKAYPFNGGKTYLCNTGCSTCNLLYTNCTACSSNYEILGSVCIPLPTTKSCTFLNDYKGFYDSYLLCQYQYPIALPMNSNIEIYYSNNWDLAGTTPALSSSSTSMAYVGVSNISVSSFTKKITMLLTSVVNSGTTLQYQLKLRNPTATSVGNNDYITYIYDSGNTLIAKSYDFDPSKTMECNLGCSSCNTIYTACLGCITGFEYYSSSTSCVQ